MRPTKAGSKASVDGAEKARGQARSRMDCFQFTRLVRDTMNSPMRGSVSATLAVALLGLLFSTSVSAQTDNAAEEVAASLAICKDSEADTGREVAGQYRPCEQYIDVHIKKDADTVKWILEQVTSRKGYANRVSAEYYIRDEILQMIIILLSLLTTVSAAITKLYPKLNIRGVDFALAPIVLSAMIAAVTSINAYYQFDEYRRLSQNLSDDLTELESDIHFLVLRHVAGQSQVQINDDTINDWQDRLKTIMQRYSQRETGNGV